MDEMKDIIGAVLAFAGDEFTHTMESGEPLNAPEDKSEGPKENPKDKTLGSYDNMTHCSYEPEFEKP